MIRSTITKPEPAQMPDTKTSRVLSFIHGQAKPNTALPTLSGVVNILGKVVDIIDSPAVLASLETIASAVLNEFAPPSAPKPAA